MTFEEFTALLGKGAIVTPIVQLVVGGLYSKLKFWITDEKDFKKRANSLKESMTQSLATRHQAILTSCFAGGDISAELAVWTRDYFSVIKKTNHLTELFQSFKRINTCILIICVMGIAFSIASFFAGDFKYIITIVSVICIIIETILFFRMRKLIGELERYEE